MSSVNDNAGSKIYQTDTHVKFGIDYTAPKVTLKETELDSGWLGRNSFTTTKGSKVIVTYPTADTNHPTQISYNLSEQDLPSDASSIAANADLSVSGADQSKFKFTAVRYDNYDDAANALSGSSEAKPGKTTSVSAVAGADGTIDVEFGSDGKADSQFNQDGVYLVKDMQVQVCDGAGNHSKINLDKGGDGVEKPKYDMIAFVGPNNQPTQSMKIYDVKDQSRGAGNVEPTSHLQWHRGSVSATLSVTDKWFDVVQQLKSLNKPGDPDNPANVRDLDLFTHDIAGDAKDNDSFVKLTTGDFKRSKADSDTWTAEVTMPTAQKGSHTGWSVEGRYALGLNYRSVGGTLATDSDPQASAHQTFGIDYTDPEFKDLRFSQTGPAQWGWVFAAGPGPESFKATTKDEVSGVCNVNDPNCSGESQFAFNGNFQQAGVEHPAYQKTSGSAGDTTDVSVSFGDDSERLTLKGSTLHISDRAGNVSSLDLGDTVMPSGYVADKDKPKLLSNLPKGTTGIAIDTKTPTIGVVYDNNDVRNGKYYKANRTATVTINESNFDFIKANDKYRDIVVTKADGSKMTVDADKFANPSKDGSTWVAQVPCDHDADWAFDVSLTDPAGHVAAPFHDEFTIDTQKPILEMKFDNNDAENGNYYKAVRTASIKQTERNFSPADTAVTVSAKDANGVAVTPPAAAPWSEANKDYERTTSVPFTGELHYSIKVTATDLAGNTAEAVEEPEFVIDMTKPKLAISQVADKTAYAGKVTPQIDFSDTNFDPMFADYTLTRTRNPDPSKKDQSAKRGQSNDNDVFLESQEQDSSTSKSVALPDVEHTVDNDDVYTLDAKVKDKAGNESEQKVVFSLNRFGSNYILDGATQNILGRYIKVPQEVHVTEINVSGLSFDKSHTELVHNQNVRSISAAQDYHLVSDQTSGWQEDTYDFPATLFNDDGYYRLRLSSVDAAGNLSQNTMNKKNEARNGDAQINFAVDHDKPTASVDELKSNAVVYAPSRNLVVDAKDDVALKSVKLKVDGRTVGQWKGKSTLSPMSQRLDADQHEHVVEVVSTDMAGNSTTTVYSGIVVATSWWAYMMARGLLLPLVFGGIIVVALGVIGVVVAVRRRKSVAYRRNVFSHSR
ncbi:Ig-like domain repeat protein [Bifidobacterium sp. ESL0798]|uniref:Ig-like domain repeat protein n=1 Tax=Bifidobacterium sp. ESL0798 TaxID=2983235 RepID=UPI0023F9E450|nr:Ig-like domain repeat protein [Bifidobacterium sp. ESL0798]WEV73614.1 Ig-like domain repeat protein [Bifidobacterium sp. ESL0798]